MLFGHLTLDFAEVFGEIFFLGLADRDFRGKSAGDEEALASEVSQNSGGLRSAGYAECIYGSYCGFSARDGMAYLVHIGGFPFEVVTGGWTAARRKLKDKGNRAP